MSIEAVSWVIRYSVSTGVARNVLTVIAWHADRTGRNSWPSQDTIAREANTTAFHVRRVCRILARLGELKILAPGDTGRGQSCAYTMPLISPQEELAFPQKGAHQEPAHLATKRGSPGAPNCPEPSYIRSKAAQPRRVPHKPFRTEQEQRRIVAARDGRQSREDEYRREIMIGAGPVCVGGIRPEVLERIRLREAARVHARA